MGKVKNVKTFKYLNIKIKVHQEGNMLKGEKGNIITCGGIIKLRIYD